MSKPAARLSSNLFPAGQRVALVVEYNGSAYHGWQLQLGSKVTTVQGELERAVAQVAACPVRLACAGRTDTGVHATHQVVHFDAPVARSLKAWQMGSNANLPDTIVVRDAHAVASDFHARFSALSRRYHYLILNTPVRSALAPRHTTWVRQPLDEKLMQSAAQVLLGELDFTSFRASSCQSTTAMRRVDFVQVYRSGELVLVDIQANAFLHHMVRNIVGALIAVGRGLLSGAGMAEILAARDRTQAPETAPASGLYLVGVTYPAHFTVPAYSSGPVPVG